MFLLLVVKHYNKMEMEIILINGVKPLKRKMIDLGKGNLFGKVERESY